MNTPKPQAAKPLAFVAPRMAGKTAAQESSGAELVPKPTKGTFVDPKVRPLANHPGLASLKQQLMNGANK